MNFAKKIFRRLGKRISSSIGYHLVKNDSNTSDLLEVTNLIGFDYGHLKSKKSKMSVDKNGEALPWFTYSSIEYLKQLNLTEKDMLEWGAGNSSVFFSKRVKSLYSIESNKEWCEMVEGFAIKNLKLIFSFEDYEREPLGLNKKFDIILIDGIKRNECAVQALKLLKKGGMIILDNSDRHPDIAELFRKKDLIEVDFHGLGPINDYSWTTSIFLHREIDLKPLFVQPTIPIGGGF